MSSSIEQAFENHKKGINEWLPISKEYYWHLLEAVSPIFMDATGFMNSETYYHTDT